MRIQGNDQKWSLPWKSNGGGCTTTTWVQLTHGHRSSSSRCTKNGRWELKAKQLILLEIASAPFLLNSKMTSKFLLKLIPIQPKEKNLNSCSVCLIKLVTLCPAIQKKKFLNLNQLKIISTHWRQWSRSWWHQTRILHVYTQKTVTVS